jgi:dihydroxy-acid dehydratase
VASLRSQRWFGPCDVAGLMHRACLKSEGISQDALGNRPVVGICNPWSEVVSCNLHFRALAQSVKRGVLQAGGLPLEFPTIALGEYLMKPTTMLYRNLMAMDVEESIRAYPFDAVVLLAGCDKTIPAELMGAASANTPAIMVTAGPAEAAVFRGRPLGAGTDLWRYTDDFRAGRITEQDYRELEAAMVPSTGHCNEMGTASTMSALVESLGMSLPGSAAIPAVNGQRYAMAEASGRRAVALAHEGLRPSQILTAAAFDNAITVLMALGGSTNAVVHLLALAGRMGVDLRLQRFHEISARTPVLVNVRPSGDYLFEDFHRAGGVPALLWELRSLLSLDAMTVTGMALEPGILSGGTLNADVIARFDSPRNRDGAIVVLRGSLAPEGAIMKRSAASPTLLRHRGRAVVFQNFDDLSRRFDDPDLTVDADSVLVLKNAGPKGGPGMPEWGQLPIPQKLLKQGVRDMVRISDGRMSGTAFGTIVLHVAPEAAAGGPLAAARDGDPILLDVERGTIDIDIPADDLRRRLLAQPAPVPKYRRGYGALFLEHVMQAHDGCDFDFLRKRADEPFETEPLGVATGWIGGW